jgi:hypothetical protein
MRCSEPPLRALRPLRETEGGFPRASRATADFRLVCPLFYGKIPIAKQPPPVFMRTKSPFPPKTPIHQVQS